MGVGFIRDKLEIKFLILYIAARVSEPLPLEGMQELTMCETGRCVLPERRSAYSRCQTPHHHLNKQMDTSGLDPARLLLLKTPRTSEWLLS